MEEMPVARGLFLREKVIVEERTRNISLINCFTRRLVEAFPSSPQTFAVYAVLTNGRGTILVDVRVTSLTEDIILDERRIPVMFLDPITETRFAFRFTRIVFPRAGVYEFSLLVAGAPVAATRVEVLLGGGPT